MMNICKSIMLRGCICTAALIVATSIPTLAHAQVTISPVQVPLSDVNCDYTAPYTQSRPCSVTGTRSATLTSITRTDFLANPAFELIDATFNVNFDGILQIDGVPVSTGPNTEGFFLDAEYHFSTNLATVDLATSYTGRVIRIARDNSPFPVDITSDRILNFSNFSTDLRSITVDINSTISDANGDDFYYNLASINPTTILNGNSVALGGSFRSTEDNSAIIIGRLSGTADLISGPNGVFTPNPNSNLDLGYVSPFGLQYNVVAEVSTQLDENGLITPTIAVTDGINMNNSIITNLGAGVAPTDAVNMAQLNAEAAARASNDAVLATAVNTEAATRASSDMQLAGAIDAEVMTRAQANLQINQRIDRTAADQTALGNALLNETNARISSDLALSNRIGGLTGRLDQVDKRLDFLDRKIAGSTAVAVALSGNTFLPDTTFNLTANVGVYDGAQAGAFQFGALITKNVAVNAGVATGFNSRGKTAARAGFTIGW